MEKLGIKSKRYMFFLSSTVDDLKEERALVLNKLIELEHIPSAVEFFNTGVVQEKIELIKSNIEASDYFILILGCSYGKLVKDDKYISYTEFEYNYAKELKKPMIIFAKEIKLLDKHQLSNDSKLYSFHKKIRKHSTIKEWDNNFEDALNFFESDISLIIRDNPSDGWVKGNLIRDVFICPSKIFIQKDDKGIEYNKNHTDELLKSNNYHYMGLTGKRCPARIRNTGRVFNEVKVMLSPLHKSNKISHHRELRKASTINIISNMGENNGKYKIERDVYIKNENKNYKEDDFHYLQTLFEVKMTIINLFYNRDLFIECEIAFYHPLYNKRLEILDDYVFVSLLNINNDTNLKNDDYFRYPKVLKFEKKSYFYKEYHSDFEALFKSLPKKNNSLIITRNTTEKDLIKKFRKLGIDKNLTKNKMKQYQAIFKLFEDEFLTEKAIKKS